MRDNQTDVEEIVHSPLHQKNQLHEKDQLHKHLLCDPSVTSTWENGLVMDMIMGSEAGATEPPGLEIAQVEEGKEVDGDERGGVEDQPHLRDVLPEQHLCLPLSVPPGGGDDVSSDRDKVAIGHTAANS